MDRFKTEDIEMAIIGLTGIALILEPILVKMNYEGLGKEDAKELKFHLRLAVKALEKQIPKEPSWEGPTNDAKDDAEAYCPECDYYLKDDTLYCPDCGQKILWP